MLHFHLNAYLEATEGERCGGRQGPWCGDGLRCIGRALLVDGQGTCIREGMQFSIYITIIFLIIRSENFAIRFSYKLSSWNRDRELLYRSLQL